MATIETYKAIAKDARLTVLEMIYRAQSSHIGSNFSCIDFLTVLFEKIDLKKDMVILSAGWKAAAFYYFLARAGYFPIDELMTYNQEGSRLIGLTEPGVPGVQFAGGSMQMGIPAAVGFALAKKMKGEEGTVYCIMSDGEIAGGMFYESTLIARHYNLDNLKLIIDGNKLQAMGRVKEILDVSSIVNLERSIFAGHDFKNIEDGLQDGELVTYFLTVKGRGVSFMEDNNLYHYKNLSEEEYDKAKREITHG